MRLNIEMKRERTLVKGFCGGQRPAREEDEEGRKGEREGVRLRGEASRNTR